MKTCNRRDCDPNNITPIPINFFVWMKTCNRRDCDSRHINSNLVLSCSYEWRPVIEGIATQPQFLCLYLQCVWMKTCNRRDCDPEQEPQHTRLLVWMKTCNRRDCDICLLSSYPRGSIVWMKTCNRRDCDPSIPLLCNGLIVVWMKTCNRRDCDIWHVTLAMAFEYEWRPVIEGIATPIGEDYSPHRVNVWMKTCNRRDCDNAHPKEESHLPVCMNEDL